MDIDVDAIIVVSDTAVVVVCGTVTVVVVVVVIVCGTVVVVVVVVCGTGVIVSYVVVDDEVVIEVMVSDFFGAKATNFNNRPRITATIIKPMTEVTILVRRLRHHLRITLTLGSYSMNAWLVCI
ncbi:unnamed protein product [Adineta steineri]|uniref:Uncharacterized protein n=1 Tax=Adineta steineri TaxID=433720 RepID=A0A814QN66_9BILA|nr:unnamed protein product [Adineta steineri]